MEKAIVRITQNLLQVNTLELPHKKEIKMV
jgi:hypothetical protein